MEHGWLDGLKRLPENQAIDVSFDAPMRRYLFDRMGQDSKEHKFLLNVGFGKNAIIFPGGRFAPKAISLQEGKAYVGAMVIEYMGKNAPHGLGIPPKTLKIYVQWLTNQYRKQTIRMEDVEFLRECLGVFYMMRNAIKELGYSDQILQYTPAKLRDATKEFVKKPGELFSVAETKFIHATEVKKIYEDDEVRVEQATTLRASVALHHKDTHWCSSRDGNSYFNRYVSEGPLFQIIHKTKTLGERKYQFHFASNQFKDARDQEIDLGNFLSILPQLKGIQDFQNALQDTRYHNQKIFRQG